MARYSSGALAAGAGSTTLPSGSLYAIATASFKLREAGVYNTTATSVALKLSLLITAGTQGAGLVEAKQDDNSGAAACTAFNTHTGGPTLGSDLGYRCQLGAAVGSAMVWTFGDVGIRVPLTTINGVGIITENGTGQVVQFYFVWDE
jgi:hypothetical protein